MPRLCSSLLLSLLIASSASAVTMDWTLVGNPGNACDPQPSAFGAPPGCFGAVEYTYSIGTYEVTNAQYAEFLNAKAASDPNELYNINMAFPATDHGGITRSGSPGSYSYSAIAGRENMPVNNVSFFDALRFANWMNNGQGSGDTETGSYILLGGTYYPSNGDTVARNAGATVVLPTENEWFKAAYYNPLSASYFDYPAGSDTPTGCSVPSGVANRANCGKQVDDFTAVGSYPGSASPYGTLDQGGNATEWNETMILAGSNRGVRGGDYSAAFVSATSLQLAASFQSARTAFSGYTQTGFRLAYIPEPSTGLLVIAGLLGLAGWRKGHP
jgi:formylglycine-generating enzyme